MKIMSIFLLLLVSIQVHAREVKIGITNSLPPYYIASDKTGVEVDIIRAAFQAAGHQINGYLYSHHKRSYILLKAKHIDASVGNHQNELFNDSSEPFYGSNTTLNYIDCAITLKKKTFQLNTIKDYYGKSIWAFQSASLVLGSEFKIMSEKNKRYIEDKDQLKQIRLLFMDRIDIIISDKNIFIANLKKHNGQNAKKESFNYFKIGKPTPRGLKFHDKKLRKDFNRGLKMIQANGEYDKILKKYTGAFYTKC